VFQDITRLNSLNLCSLNYTASTVQLAQPHLGRAGGALEALGPSGLAALTGRSPARSRSKLVFHTITCSSAPPDV
jgi:hypothetical protein